MIPKYCQKQLEAKRDGVINQTHIMRMRSQNATNQWA